MLRLWDGCAPALSSVRTGQQGWSDGSAIESKAFNPKARGCAITLVELEQERFPPLLLTSRKPVKVKLFSSINGKC